LVVVAVACLFLGNAALSMRQDVYSAQNVDREAQQIVGSSNVQAALADLLTDKVVEPVITQTGAGLFSVLSSPLTSVARRLIEQAVATQPVQHVAARLVEQVVPELQRGSGPVSLTAQQLAWIVSPGLASNRLIAGMLHTADRSGCCQVVLAQRQSLSFAWRYVQQIRLAGVVLPALFVVFAGLALWITRRRRRVALILAGATAATGLLTLGLVWAGPQFWSSLIGRPGPSGGVVRAADGAVFAGVTAGLRAHCLMLAAVGVGALVALAISRRGRLPIAAR
jgi:hypothetical protein